VEVNEELSEYIDRVVEGYPIRGFDAIHLASALAIHKVFPDDFVFACFDDRLARAAKSEGLQVMGQK
jgi:predicted nucleic acid-binding protein